MKKIILIALVFIMSAGLQSADNKADLHVIVTGLKSSDGWVVCHLFNSEDGYPTKSKKAMKYINDYDLKNHQAEFLFKDLPPGDYAFTVHHDENGNKKMDKNFLGIPNEGWACSNNATGALGIPIPSFDDAKFTVNGKEVTQTVEINY